MTGWEDDRPTGADVTTDAGVTGDPEVDQLVDEIEVTREEMTVTVEQIGDRLDPKNIVAGAKETVRDATVGKVENMANSAQEMVSNAGQTAQQAGSGLVETIRRNPIPAAMAGIGLGWLAMSARGSSSSRSSFAYGDRYRTDRYAGYEGYGGSSTWDTASGGGAWASGGAQPQGYQGQGYQGFQGQGGQGGGIGEKVGQVGETAGQAVSQVTDTVGQAAGQVGQTVGQVGQNVSQAAGQVGQNVSQAAGQVPYQVQGVARQVGDNVGRMFQSNPLAMGAVAVGIGTAIGMALPVTEIERRTIGQPAQQALAKVEETASDALGQAEQTARDVEDQAREQDMQAKPH